MSNNVGRRLLKAIQHKATTVFRKCQRQNQTSCNRKSADVPVSESANGAVSEDKTSGRLVSTGISNPDPPRPNHHLPTLSTTSPTVHPGHQIGRPKFPDDGRRRRVRRHSQPRGGRGRAQLRPFHPPLSVHPCPNIRTVMETSMANNPHQLAVSQRAYTQTDVANDQSIPRAHMSSQSTHHLQKVNAQGRTEISEGRWIASSRASLYRRAYPTYKCSTTAVQNRQSRKSSDSIIDADDASWLMTPQGSGSKVQSAIDEANLITVGTQIRACGEVLKEARRLYACVCRVKSSAKTYACGFGMEVPSQKVPYIVMKCSFDGEHGVLMAGLYPIVSRERVAESKDNNSLGLNDALIRIERNEFVLNGSLLQTDMWDEGGKSGKHRYVDTRKVHHVPVDLVVKDGYGPLKLCDCVWAKVRDKMSLSSLPEERLGLEREFKRYQAKMIKIQGIADQAIYMFDDLPRHQAPSKPQPKFRPHLRRYRVEELLHRPLLVRGCPTCWQ